MDRWKSWAGIRCETLKMIAMISMLIDHFGAGILGRYLNLQSMANTEGGLLAEAEEMLRLLYRTSRGIGRLAFPIYCVLLVEGVKHTGNVYKYLMRLLLFAFLSEIPFDLYFNNRFLEFGSQNVFFTLTIALAVLVGLRKTVECMQIEWARVVAGGLLVLTGIVVADGLSTDYAGLGVCCIVAIYFAGGNCTRGRIVGAGVFCFEFPMGPLAFPILAMYRGRKGSKRKYLYYLFYPLHLLLLFLLSVLLGIWRIPSY